MLGPDHNTNGNGIKSEIRELTNAMRALKESVDISNEERRNSIPLRLVIYMFAIVLGAYGGFRGIDAANDYLRSQSANAQSNNQPK